MALPTVTGKGFLLSDGVELQFSKSGMAWARLPLSFRNSRKGPDGNWTHDKAVTIDATVFGGLAEYLVGQLPDAETPAVEAAGAPAEEQAGEPAGAPPEGADPTEQP